LSIPLSSNGDDIFSAVVVVVELLLPSPLLLILPAEVDRDVENKEVGLDALRLLLLTLALALLSTLPGFVVVVDDDDDDDDDGADDDNPIVDVGDGIVFVMMLSWCC